MYLFIIMLILAFVLASAKRYDIKFIFTLGKYLILFWVITPISL